MLDEAKVSQIKLTRKYLKLKLIEDNVTFCGHSSERQQLYDLVDRSVRLGESHSVLLIGPKGSGKTTLVNSVLEQISKQLDITNDAVIIKLNGLIHHNEKVALKAITAQMQLENAVGDRVFGNFAENFTFLLSCLQSGCDRSCKSMLFVLDQFDMFCHVGRSQTLLYNLFDITHNKQAPMCVIGLTNRLDVIDLLEKRVKSRFSQRSIFLSLTEDNSSETPLEITKNIFVRLLSLPKRSSKKSKKRKDEDNLDIYGISTSVLERCHTNCMDFDGFDADYVDGWNCNVKMILQSQEVENALEKFCYFNVNEQTLRDLLFQVISRLSQTKPTIDAADITSAIDNNICADHRVALLHSLSILELSLVIAMKHGMEIFDGRPMNFEMVLHRYMKFANTNSSTQNVPRPVILKAFEHLQALEIIVPVRNEAIASITTSRVQKEYQLYSLNVPVADVQQAVKSFKALPTEISHWCNDSTI